MDELKTFAPGEPLTQWPDGTWNRLVAGEQRDRQRPIPSPPPGWSAGEGAAGVPVRVQNNSGATVEVGGVLVLGAALIDPADRPNTVHDGPQFVGDAPNAATADDALFVVLAETVRDGFSGRGIVLGATWARLTVSDAGHEYARLGVSSAALVSAASGPARIAWKPAGTGTFDALVVLGSQSTAGAAHLVVPAETIPAAKRLLTMVGGQPQWQLKLGTGTCYIYERDGAVAVPALDGAGEPRTLTVYNFCRETYQAASVAEGSGSGSASAAPPDVVQLDDGTPVLFAVRDHKGDYYITRDCYAVGSMSSSSGSSSGSDGSSSAGSSDSGSDSGGSDSGGSGSEGSANGSGGDGCAGDPYSGTLEVVVDAEWDEETCTMTLTKKTLTFAGGELCSVED